MANTPEKRYANQVKKLSRLVEKSKISETDGDLIKALCDAFDSSKRSPRVPKKPKGETVPFNLHHRYKTKSPGTRAAWIKRLTRLAKEEELVSATPKDLDALLQSGMDGELPRQSSGWSDRTTRAYECALRIFYWYHGVYRENSEFETVDPHVIRLTEINNGQHGADRSSFDPTDILTRNEIGQVRKAIDHPRDRAVFELLLNTGLRNQALRNLRVRDIDLENGTYRFNTAMSGNKNVHKPDVPRPLGLATDALQKLRESGHEWDPDMHVIIAKKEWADSDPYQPLSPEAVRRCMNNLKKWAGVEKPMHPHMVRHNFVTICKRDYELPDDTVKFLIGHSPDSDVMETTYAHLGSDDHQARLEVAQGIREPEEKEDSDRFRPEACPRCRKPTHPGDLLCSRCGFEWGPDAQNASANIEEMLFASKGQAAANDDSGAEAGVDAVRELVKQNPEIKATVMEEMKDELLEEILDELD